MTSKVVELRPKRLELCTRCLRIILLGFTKRYSVLYGYYGQHICPCCCKQYSPKFLVKHTNVEIASSSSNSTIEIEEYACASDPNYSNILCESCSNGATFYSKYTCHPCHKSRPEDRANNYGLYCNTCGFKFCTSDKKIAKHEPNILESEYVTKVIPMLEKAVFASYTSIPEISIQNFIHTILLDPELYKRHPALNDGTEKLNFFKFIKELNKQCLIHHQNSMSNFHAHPHETCLKTFFCYFLAAFACFLDIDGPFALTVEMSNDGFWELVRQRLLLQIHQISSRLIS